MKKPVTLQEIRNRQGVLSTDEHAEILAGEYIRLFGQDHRYVPEDGRMVVRDVPYDLTFKVGDTAEYDSFNFHYTGVITSITEKTVSIKGEDDGQTRRLTIFEFSWRNKDFDLEKIKRINQDVFETC